MNCSCKRPALTLQKIISLTGSWAVDTIHEQKKNSHSFPIPVHAVTHLSTAHTRWENWNRPTDTLQDKRYSDTLDGVDAELSTKWKYPTSRLNTWSFSWCGWVGPVSWMVEERPHHMAWHTKSRLVGPERGRKKEREQVRKEQVTEKIMKGCPLKNVYDTNSYVGAGKVWLKRYWCDMEIKESEKESLPYSNNQT